MIVSPFVVLMVNGLILNLCPKKFSSFGSRFVLVWRNPPFLLAR
jgi:hypothetical protein